MDNNKTEVKVPGSDMQFTSPIIDDVSEARKRLIREELEVKRDFDNEEKKLKREKKILYHKKIKRWLAIFMGSVIVLCLLFIASASLTKNFNTYAMSTLFVFASCLSLSLFIWFYSYMYAYHLNSLSELFLLGIFLEN